MPWWAWSWSLPVVDGFNKLPGGYELHPPVELLSRQTAGIEAADVLHSGQQAGRVSLDKWRIRKSPLLVGSAVSTCDRMPCHDLNNDPYTILEIITFKGFEPIYDPAQEAT